MPTKPTSIRIEELRKNLIDTVNEAELPACITDIIVQQFSASVHQVAEQTNELEKHDYERSVQKEKQKADSTANAADHAVTGGAGENG